MLGHLLNQALAALPCKRRILLSGTPMQVRNLFLIFRFALTDSHCTTKQCIPPSQMQNDLEEFFAMVNFTNPGILGEAAHFRRYYEVSKFLFLHLNY